VGSIHIGQSGIPPDRLAVVTLGPEAFYLLRADDSSEVRLKFECTTLFRFIRANSSQRLSTHLWGLS
jgi:hypothetical protein